MLGSCNNRTLEPVLNKVTGTKNIGFGIKSARNSWKV